MPGYLGMHSYQRLNVRTREHKLVLKFANFRSEHMRLMLPAVQCRGRAAILKSVAIDEMVYHHKPPKSTSVL